MMLNWISSASIVQAGQASPLYVNTKISMIETLRTISQSMSVLGSNAHKTRDQLILVAF